MLEQDCEVIQGIGVCVLYDDEDDTKRVTVDEPRGFVFKEYGTKLSSDFRRTLHIVKFKRE